MPINACLALYAQLPKLLAIIPKPNEIGVLGTKGTVQSRLVLLEIEHFAPELKVHQQACPLWVPLIENGEYDKPGADYYVQLVPGSADAAIAKY
jgi:glutamate racemase